MVFPKVKLTSQTTTITFIRAVAIVLSCWYVYLPTHLDWETWERPKF